MQQVSGIAQGDTDSDRTGDRVMLKKIYLRWNLVGYDTYNFVRFMVFQWKPDNLISPIPGDILLPGSSGAIDFTSQYNHDKRQMYKIMYDKVLTTVGDGSQTSLTVYPYQSNFIHYNKKTLIIPNKQLQYDGGSSTIGTNQIYVMAVSDSLVPTHPLVSYTMKILYTDS